MKKYITILIVTALAACFVPQTMAQDNNEDYIKVLEKNQELNDLLRSKEAEIVRRDSTIGELQRQIAQLNNELQSEKESAKKQDIGNANEQLSKANAQIGQLEADIRRLQSEMKNKDQELEALRPFKKQMLDNMVTNVESDWLSKPYSQISLNDLQYAIANYGEYASDDSKIKEAYNKLNAFKEECSLYQQGVAALEQPYDNEMVNKLEADLTTLKNSTRDEAKLQELVTVIDNLYYYQGAIPFIQNLISDTIEAKIADYESRGLSAKIVWGAVGEILNENGSYLAILEKLPWLNEQFNGYLNKLKEDCFKNKNNHYRETIMDLHVEY